MHASGLPTPLLPLLAAAVGISSTVQAAVNAEISGALGAPAAAAMLAYGLAVCLMLGVTAILRPAGSLPPLTFARRPHWYELTGGACGCAFLLIAVASAPSLGVALFFALAVAGQLASSLAIDAYGMLDFKPSRVTRARVLAVAVALVGAALSSASDVGSNGSDEVSGDGEATAAKGVVPALNLASTSASAVPALPRVIFMVLAFVGGSLQPVQAVVNSRLASLLPQRVQAAVVSLLVSLALVTALLLAQSAAGAGAPSLGVLAWRLFARVRPVAFLGGTCIAAIVAGGVFLPAAMGTARYYLSYLAGELVASIALDAVGAFGLTVRAPTGLRLFASALVLSAAAAQGGGGHEAAAATATPPAAATGGAALVPLPAGGGAASLPAKAAPAASSAGAVGGRAASL